MKDAVSWLQQVGFGEYEARAYLSLLQHSPLNGYELAKVSGVPRPNVYSVLQKLEERGAVVRMDTPSGARFAAVPPLELLARMESQFHDAIGAARHTLEALPQPVQPDFVWNLQGLPTVLQHARSLLEGARDRLLVAVRLPEARDLSDDLAGAQHRGVQLTTLCLEGCPEPCGHCQGGVHRVAVDAGCAVRWLVLVADGAEMLAGEIGPGAEALAVRSRRRLLVEMADWYVYQTIAQAALVSDLGDRMEAILRPETRSVLAGLGGHRGGWLDHMRGLLRGQMD